MQANASLPNPGRRALLRGTWRKPATAIRPPWATEHTIVDSCRHCDACIDACPQDILFRGDGGFPTVDFNLGRGECTFCGDCADACPEPVFDRDLAPAWSLTLSIDETACLPHAGVHCEACRDICDQAAISFKPRLGGPARPGIDEDACTGCGACLSVCPSQAIKATPCSETV